MAIKDFSVILTGEWPGAGQSTTASLLAERLQFKRVYAGLLFRKFAHIWNLEKHHYSWDEFQALAESKQLDLNTYPFSEKDFNEAELHAWQHQLKSVNTPDLWDKIIDTQSLLAITEPGVVLEAKVGVLLDRTHLVDLSSVKHPIYKVLLTCPPEISAHRVIKRKIKNGELPPMKHRDPAYDNLVRQTTSETIKRHLRDWERYEKIYSTYRSDIYLEDVIKVNTSRRSQAQVVESVVRKITKLQLQA